MPTRRADDPRSIPWSSSRRIQDSAPIGLTNLTSETIRVVDPTHPLYDLTLPLVGVTTTARLGRACVVWLQPRVTRVIPWAATSLAAVTPSPSPCRLAVTSVQRLLTVVASLPAREPEDAHAARCECPAPPTAAAAVRPAAHCVTAPPRSALDQTRAGVGELVSRGATADPADVAAGAAGGHH